MRWQGEGSPWRAHSSVGSSPHEDQPLLGPDRADRATQRNSSSPSPVTPTPEHLGLLHLAQEQIRRHLFQRSMFHKPPSCCGYRRESARSWLFKWFLFPPNSIWISHFPFKRGSLARSPRLGLSPQHTMIRSHLKMRIALEPPAPITAEAALAGAVRQPCFQAGTWDRQHRHLLPRHCLGGVLPTTVSPLPAAQAHGNHSSACQPGRGQQGSVGQAGSLISSHAAPVPLARAHRCHRRSGSGM